MISGWVATMIIKAPTDGDVFLAYLEQVLCPQLRPTHCVVMDNLAAYKVTGVRELIEATGARLRHRSSDLLIRITGGYSQAQPNGRKHNLLAVEATVGNVT